MSISNSIISVNDIPDNNNAVALKESSSGDAKQIGDTTDTTLSVYNEYDIWAPTVRSLLLEYYDDDEAVDNSKSNSDSIGCDFLIMKDYTQGPARLKSRNETIHALSKNYVLLRILSLEQQQNQ